MEKGYSVRIGPALKALNCLQLYRSEIIKDDDSEGEEEFVLAIYKFTQLRMSLDGDFDPFTL